MERTGLVDAKRLLVEYPHQLTATFRKRASLLPIGKWELPPFRTINSFQCFCNLLPVCFFREHYDATFDLTPANPVVLVGAGLQLFSGAIPNLGDLPRLNPLKYNNPSGRYCPSYTRVISTVLHFSASDGNKEDGGIEPLRHHCRTLVFKTSCRPFSGIFQHGSWRSRTPTHSSYSCFRGRLLTISSSFHFSV